MTGPENAGPVLVSWIKGGSNGQNIRRRLLRRPPMFFSFRCYLLDLRTDTAVCYQERIIL